MSRFMSERFAGLHAYTPGEQPQDMQYVKLNTNESPYPPSPEVLERLNAAEIEKLQLYPDPEGWALRRKLAALYNVGAENIFLSNGSDEILNFAFLAFCDETHGVLFPDISYGFYPVYAALYGITAKQMPLRADFTIDPQPYCRDEGMVVIANPNAPTGLELPQEEIARIAASNPNHVVILDEAYIDFGGTSCVEVIKQYENLLVVQTFSKSRSMAGARLGFAIASKGLIQDLNQIKYSTNPYNINRLTLAAGEAAVDSQAYYTQNCAKIMETRERVTAQLRKMGFTVLASVANFIMIRADWISGAALYRGLKEKGVLVRHFDKERIRDYVRVTIGTDAQMDVFLEKTAELREEAKARAKQ